MSFQDELDHENRLLEIDRQVAYINATSRYNGFLMAMAVKYQTLPGEFTQSMFAEFEDSYRQLLRNQVSEAYMDWLQKKGE